MIALILSLAVGGPHPAAVRPAEKTDVVVLQNGNEILGELKSLLRGVLKLKTDSAGTLAIEWDEVLSVTSPSRFLFETTAGKQLVGTLPAAPRAGVLVIQANDGERHTLELSQIVWLQEFDQSAWERVDGYVNAGYSFTKASDVTQLSFGAGFSYYERSYSLSLGSSLVVTDQKDDDTARKADLDTFYRYLLAERWFVFATGQLEHNSELALDLRVTTGAGPGRFLIQRQTQDLNAYGGLAVSYEVPDGGSSTTELEGLLGGEYRIYITDTPETNLSLALIAFPGITDAGSLRGGLDVALNKELVDDFYFSVTSYLDYDSDPGSDDGNTTDYGIVTGFSYTW